MLLVNHDKQGTTKEVKMEATETRSIATIAREIKGDWKNVWFGAVPYLEAMFALDSINDDYYADSGRSVVAYFLGNAAQWRGETARRVKLELKGMLK